MRRWRTAQLALLSVLAATRLHAAGTIASCAPTRVIEGCGTYTWPDGTRYVGGFHGGFFDGPARILFSDGARLELTYRDGTADTGVATYTDSDSTVVSGPLQDVSRDLAHPHMPVGYPFWRALFGDQADVIIAIVVDKDGTVRTSQVYSDVKSASFAKAAVDGVKQWRYLPASIGGKAIRIPYVIDLQFSQPR